MIEIIELLDLREGLEIYLRQKRGRREAEETG
jgi:hypothetical protein